jgi:N6-adenosine-specific RNA methylase IME4
MRNAYSKKSLQHRSRLARRSPASLPARIPPFPKGKFEIVYADPPWFHYGSPIKDAAAAKHYPLMSQDSLARLPVRELMAKRAALFLWATGPRLHFAMDLLKRWSLHFRGVLYVWVKTNRQGKIICGQGVLPTFTKPTTEFVLAATTMPTGRPFPLADLAQAQVVLHPRAAHSAKPAIFREMIERLCGKRSKIELFARESAPGWTSWGVDL